MPSASALKSSHPPSHQKNPSIISPSLKLNNEIRGGLIGWPWQGMSRINGSGTAAAFVTADETNFIPTKRRPLRIISRVERHLTTSTPHSSTPSDDQNDEDISPSCGSRAYNSAPRRLRAPHSVDFFVIQFTYYACDNQNLAFLSHLT